MIVQRGGDKTKKAKQAVGTGSLKLDGQDEYKPPAPSIRGVELEMRRAVEILPVLEESTSEKLEAEAKEEKDEEAKTAEVEEVISVDETLGLDEYCSLADKWYCKSFQSAQDNGAVHIVASHLSSDAMRDLKAFCSKQCNGGKCFSIS